MMVQRDKAEVVKTQEMCTRGTRALCSWMLTVDRNGSYELVLVIWYEFIDHTALVGSFYFK